MCVLQRLQELHLQHNSLEALSEQALAGLASLALLDLSRNSLHTLGPAALQPLVSLQVLRITGVMGGGAGSDGHPGLRPPDPLTPAP